MMNVSPPLLRGVDPSIAGILGLADEEMAASARRFSQWAERFADASDGPSASAMAAFLRAEAESLQSCRRGLEVFARAGAAPVCRTATDMGRELKILAAIFTPLAERHRCRLTISHQPGVRFRWLLDAVRVRQITGNLICHAIGRSANGTVRLVYSEWRNGEATGIRFEILLTECGDALGTEAGAMPGPGGFGPAVVRRLCALLNGRYLASDDPEPTLRFDLPCLPADWLLPPEGA